MTIEREASIISVSSGLEMKLKLLLVCKVYSIGVSTGWRRGKVVQSSPKLLWEDLMRIVEQRTKKEKEGFLPETFLTLKWVVLYLRLGFFLSKNDNIGYAITRTNHMNLRQSKLYWWQSVKAQSATICQMSVRWGLILSCKDVKR